MTEVVLEASPTPDAPKGYLADGKTPRKRAPKRKAAKAAARPSTAKVTQAGPVGDVDFLTRVEQEIADRSAKLRDETAAARAEYERLDKALQALMDARK